jgi:hypothetical protein
VAWNKPYQYYKYKNGIKRQMKKYLFLGMLAVCQIAAAEDIQPVSEQAGSGIIEGSYIVTLNPDDPEVPGLFIAAQEESQNIEQSAKIKEDFADKLGIDGIVEHIYPSIYAVHIKMNSLEANLLTNDKRVLRIELDQMISVSSMGSVSAENMSGGNYPTYQDGILTIPRVDTPKQPGNYLDATFKQIDQNLWELQGYKTANEYPLQKAPIGQAKLVVTDSFPVQVFLNIQGTFTSGCGDLGQINQRLVGNRFEVTVHAEYPDLPPGSFACTANMRYFEKNIPLAAYDLNAGNYEYSINGGDYTGTFTLAKDNRYPLTNPNLLPAELAQ